MSDPPVAEGRLRLGPGAMLLSGFARPQAPALLEGIARIAAAAPFRRMVTPGGKPMSVEMTSCGAVGWVSDRGGYRYAPQDPVGGAPWPAMPPDFLSLAIAAAATAGHHGFDPDSCLVNRYRPGAQMSMHQDRNERDFTAPIVSVSLGLRVRFMFGGASRTGPRHSVWLDHGDVVVWGGPTRLAFHGVAPLAEGSHPATGSCRYNLTFRRAL